MKTRVPQSKTELPTRTPIDERVPVVAVSENTGVAEAKSSRCPYCESAEFVKRGTRKKKHESIQLYQCTNPACGRTFSETNAKGRRYPMKLVIEGMSYYNLGFTLEATCSILRKKFGASPEPKTLSEWIERYKPLCRYERMRPYAVKMYRPTETMECVTLAHPQLYNFRYHRAKMRLALEEYKNRRFDRLKDFLDAVATETPHQLFGEGERMSEVRSRFDKAEMIVKSKTNFANMLAAFALSGAKNNKGRHEAVQRFMIANDSVTVATEVPVFIRREDIEHLQNELKFEVVNSDVGLEVRKRKGRSPAEVPRRTEAGKRKRDEPKAHGNTGTGLPALLTGHIDIVQVRNGIVHILDYKPHARKEKPIEQLTWYALALSRLTGLRLFEFKCAWFDEKDYFEFYPLHVVKKLHRKKEKKVLFRDGTRATIPRTNQFVAV